MSFLADFNAFKHMITLKEKKEKTGENSSLYLDSPITLISNFLLSSLQKTRDNLV